ncbi:MAG: RHS repeat-associated core domain-containing protein, partial [Planctomycetota bacterium]
GKELGSWTENVTNRYTYTAREYDEESAQYYYRARYYDGEGRFGHRDPALPYAYIYVSNSPLLLSDPFGLYGRDIHYGLTSALAKYAGFGWDYANAIGGITNEVDKEHPPVSLARGALFDYLTSKNATFESDRIEAIRRGRLKELRIIRWHFPQVLGSHTVEEGSEIARKRVEYWLGECEYVGFAKALHVFQDSYSHSGNPPLGWFFDDSFGHSWKDVGTLRPAAWSNDADDAWRRPELAERMAAETYKYLARFVEQCLCEKPRLFDHSKYPPRRFDASQFERFWQPPPPRNWDIETDEFPGVPP